MKRADGSGGNFLPVIKIPDQPCFCFVRWVGVGRAGGVSELWEDGGCEKGRHIPSLLPQLSRVLHDMFQRSAEGVWFVLTLGVDTSA